MLMRISADKDIKERLKDYIQYKQEVREYVADIGSENDRERFATPSFGLSLGSPNLFNVHK